MSEKKPSHPTLCLSLDVWNAKLSFDLKHVNLFSCLQTEAKHARGENLHIIWDFLLIRANLHFRMPVATSQMKSWNCVKPFNLLALPKRWTSQLVYQIVTRRKLLKRLLTRQQVLQRKYLLEETTIRAEGKSPLSYLLQGVQSSLVHQSQEIHSASYSQHPVKVF